MLNTMTTKEQNIDRLVIITAITFVVSFLGMILISFFTAHDSIITVILAVISVISFISTIVITVIEDNN
jgi:multisubunit Na+/H+ antiporter MnhF subunit